MSAPTTAFPAITEPHPPTGPWTNPPGHQTPTPPQPPDPTPWTGAPQQSTWATTPPPNQDVTPWTPENLDDHPGRNVPGGVTIWQGQQPPAQPAAGVVNPYPRSQTHPPQAAPESARRRGMALFAVIAATLSAVVAVAALMFVLADRVGGPDAGTTVVPTGEPNGPDVPTQGGTPPGDITLDDQGSAVEVRWSDPAGGQVPFMVTMARPGETLRPVSPVGPGETSFRMGGLNRRLNYCFAVVAVYETDRFATSDQVCTERR